MEAVIVLACIYIALYLAYILRLIMGFSKMKTIAPKNSNPKTTFSIVIPFRDEAENLTQLLESIKNLNYPKTLFEIIFIDDFSTDESAKIVYKWRMENGEYHVTLIESVRITGSPKKDAIARAVPIVGNEWIITTDADCLLPKNWLSELNNCILDNDVSMIAGPVIYNGKASLSNNFQLMDMLSLQGATIGSFGIGKPFMCNGANFAYSKALFQELKGFQGNENSASGDDVFLLQKAVANSTNVHYLKSKDAIVLTKPVNGWISLFHQRARWASKAKAYENDFGELISWVVFLGNFCLLVLFALSAAKLFRWEYFGILFGLKLFVDWILIYQANGFLRNGRFILPVLSSLIYPFFSCGVALYSVFGKYRWKGRVF
ncbi:MAG: glycosyltransferase [Flavobacterium sp.]|nr:MAG: glycosyltransferase [Flavobacterium sp.]